MADFLVYLICGIMGIVFAVMAYLGIKAKVENAVANIKNDRTNKANGTE